MDKKLLVPLFLLSIISIFSMSTCVTAANFNVSVSPVNLNASTSNQFLNFTIGNEGPGAIILVNVTSPTGFSFINYSNGTSVSDTTFTNTTANVTWEKAGLIAASEEAHFWANFSVPSTTDPTDFNFTVSVVNETSDDWNSTNAAVTVYPNGLISPTPSAGEYGSRTIDINCSAYDSDYLSFINLTMYFTNNTIYNTTLVNVTGDGIAEWNHTKISHTFSKDVLRQVNETFSIQCSHNDTSGNSWYATDSRNIVIAVSDLYGDVKFDNNTDADNVNVSLYRFAQGVGGPPTETYLTSNMTNENGTFTIYDVNIAGSTSTYRIYFNLNNSNGNVTHTGPTLPPFPRDIVFEKIPGGQLPSGITGINGSTIYLQDAGTIRIYATNSTDSQDFGYEVVDQAMGFPIKSSVLSSVSTVDVVVPRDRNYTVIVMRDPTQFPFDSECTGSVMNDTHCPAPPVSNGTIYNTMFTEGNEYVLNVTMNMSVSSYRLTGYINVTDGHNASSIVNVTKIVPRIVPWEGFIPPVKAEIDSFDLATNVNHIIGVGNDTVAFYNISVMGSADGVNYFVEFYGNDSTNYLAALQNISITGDTELNVSMSRLAGAYTTGTDVNTSMTTVRIVNSTNDTISTNPHVELEITHDSFNGGNAVHYMIESLSSGTFTHPFLNDSTVKTIVYPQDGAPRKKTLNLSENNLNVTVRSFEMKFYNETSGQFEEFDTTKKSNLEVEFYRYTSGCNDQNPPASCQLGDTYTGDFNPLQAMMAGKANLRMNLTSSNVVLYFINVDLIASGPPDANVAESYTSRTSTSSSFEEAWKFGSLAPDIYDHVWVGIPYSDLTESWSYTMNIPYLYDEDWNMVWNTSANGTNPGASLTEYSDYSTDWFDEVSCDKSDSSAKCFMNTTTDFFWLKIPHFSGLQPTMSGTAPATTTTTTSTSTTSTTTTQDKVSKKFTSINPMVGAVMRESNLGSTNTDLTEIKLEVKNRVTQVTIAVERHASKPSDTSGSPSSKVYKYMDISVDNIGDEMESATIKFKVEKSWIEENGADADKIAMFRYADDSWEKLDTVKTNEDVNYVYYEVTTTGFSYFSVAESDAEFSFWDIINYIEDYYNGAIGFWDLIDYISEYYG